MLCCASTTPIVGTYNFSSSETDFLRHGNNYLGCMRSSMAGTQFHLYDFGMSRSDGGEMLGMARRQQALLVYKTNVMGRIPNAMSIVLPKPGVTTAYYDDETATTAGGGSKVDGSMMYKAYASKKQKDKFIVLETKKPRWNPKMDAWTMDFKGRAKLASKKNFQLVDIEDQDRILMLFGKMTKNRWCLDYSPPMSPLNCLFVALTAFSAKLAVT